MAGLLAMNCARDQSHKRAKGVGQPAATNGSAASSSTTVATRIERERAVLDLLAGGSSATDLPIVDRDPGREWNPWLRDKLAPALTVAPQVRFERLEVSGEMSPDLVRQYLRSNYGRFRLCYEMGLWQTPELEGTVDVTFMAEANGSVRDAKSEAGTTLSDLKTVPCLLRQLEGRKLSSAGRGTSRISATIGLTPGASSMSAVRTTCDSTRRIMD
jgi:hypothetical protein